MAKMLQQRTGTEMLHADLMSHDMAARVCGEADRLQNTYYAKIRTLSVISNPGRGDRSVFASARGEAGYMRLNPVWWSEGKDDKRTKACKLGVTTGFHPEGCNAPEHIIAHEYGHILDAHLGKLNTPGAGFGYSPSYSQNIRGAMRDSMEKTSRYAQTN